MIGQWVVLHPTLQKQVIHLMEVVMAMEENLRRRKYKFFLVIIKYLPYLIMLLDWLHTFSCVFGKQWVAISYIGGTSYLVLLSMLLISYVFEFYSYHRVSLYYILLNNTLVLYDYYIGIPISNQCCICRLLKEV